MILHTDKSFGTILCLLDYTALMARLNIETTKRQFAIFTFLPLENPTCNYKKIQVECAGLDLDCLTFQNLTASE